MNNRSRLERLLIFLSTIAVLLILRTPPQGALASPDADVVSSSHAIAHVSSLRLSTHNLQNLSQIGSGGSLPSIVKTSSAAIVVAWQQNVPFGNTVQQEIFARSSLDGVNFDPVVNVSNTTTNSREPYLFNVNGGDVYVLYEDLPGTTKQFQIMNSVWTNGTWSVPVRLTSQSSWTYQDPAGVQATDGTLWYATQTWFGSGTWTDILAQQIGGNGLIYNLSKDGSAVHRPTVAAGVNGQVYVGWIDHANEKPHVKPGFQVREWNGSAWVSLPNASTEGYTAFPALAFHNGQLYAAWPTAVGTVGIKERIWNGNAWGPTSVFANGPARYLRLAVSSNGNVFMAWESNNTVYLKENNNAPIVVSAGLSSAHQPSLFVDDNDVAYVVFQAGGIWYTTVP